MSLSTTYALLAALIGLIAAAALIDWRWLPKDEPPADDAFAELDEDFCDRETRQRLNALAAASDRELWEMR